MSPTKATARKTAVAAAAGPGGAENCGDGTPQAFESQAAWTAWLRAHHSTSSGIWLRIAKKDAGVASVSYAQAVDSALCYGWIDGQKKSEDARFYLQRFTPRVARSPWSKINRDKALALIESGKMRKAGREQIERAQQDGRWDAAYDSPRNSAVPEDFQGALDRNARAKAFFATLDGANKYAVLYRIQTVKKEETRARKIKQFTEMLARHEKIHP